MSTTGRGLHSQRKRLVGWKAIGHHLGCTARTARRWEASRALPVHRIPGGDRGAVWAAPEELQAWLEETRGEDSGPVPPIPNRAAAASTGAAAPAGPRAPTGPRAPNGAGAPTGAAAAVVAPAERSGKGPRRRGLAALACAALVTAALEFWAHGPESKPSALATNDSPYGDDAVAQATYLDARFDLSSAVAGGPGIAKAEFLELTKRYPDAPAAWVGLADAYLLLRESGALTDAQAFAMAAAATQTALARGPRYADAWVDSAYLDYWWHDDAKSAFGKFATALKLDPGSAKAYHWYAMALQAHGDNDAALTALARARSLDPDNRAIVADQGWVLFAAGRRAEGERQLQRLVELDPRCVDAQEWLARVYLVEERDRDFLRAASAAATLRGQAQRLRDLEEADKRLEQGGRQAMLGKLVDSEEPVYRQVIAQLQPH